MFGSVVSPPMEVAGSAVATCGLANALSYRGKIGPTSNNAIVFDDSLPVGNFTVLPGLLVAD